MSKNKILQPKIRFKEFSSENAEAWEQRKLGDLIIINSGRDYKYLKTGNIPVYGTGGLITKVNKSLSKNKNAIGIGRKGTIDKPFILHAPFWTVDTLFYCIPNTNIDISFVYSLFLKVNWKSFDESTGVPSLSKNVINKITTYSTQLQEQIKIGNFFNKLNDTITLHQRKLEALEHLKKTLLSKMFPKNGKAVPELRFAGFTDNWEQRRLGEISNSYSGGTPSVGKKEYYGGDIPFIRSAEINSENTELTISEAGLNNSSAKIVEVGDILYAMYGATSGEVGISRINGAINQAILAIRPKEYYDSQFIMQWLRDEKQKILDKYLQGGQGNLSGSIVKDLKILFPNYDEQRKIGAFFERFDHLITLHQRKIEQYQELKKTLLSKMFI